MANFVSSDSIKSIKSLCDSYGITKTLSSSRKKNLVPFKIAELTKKNTFKPAIDESETIKSWLLAQDPSKLHSIFLHCEPFISQILIQMHIHKYYNGHTEFSLLNKLDKRSSDIELKSIFAAKKVSPAKCRALKEEAKLEKALRFSDSEEYCDSLSLEIDMIRTPIEMLRLFDIISGGQCFKSACKAYWDNANKQWGFEYPRWLDPFAINSLARWACASFERSVWLNYFKTHNQDPRASGESKDLGMKDLPEAVPESLVSIENTYFSVKKTQGPSIFPIRDKQIEVFMEIVAKLNTHDTVADYYGPAYSLIYKTKDTPENMQNPKSLDLLIDKLEESDNKVVEFLFFSPIRRVSSVFDVVLKFFGMKIRDLYNQKLMEELLTQENTGKNLEIPRQKTGKKPKATKNQVNKANNRLQSSPKKYVRNDQRDNADACKQITKHLVEKIFNDLYKSFSDESIIKQDLQTSEAKNEENDFQVVNQRKNKRPQPQQKASLCNLEHNKPKLLHRGKNGSKKKLNSSTRPKKSNFLWERGSNAPSLVANDADFPPLAPAVSHI